MPPETSLDTAIDFFLSEIAKAQAWSLKLSDRNFKVVWSSSKEGDVATQFPGFNSAMNDLFAPKTVTRTSWHWHDRESTRDFETSAASGHSLLNFVHRFDNSRILYGGIVFDRDALDHTSFAQEDVLLTFIGHLASTELRWRKLDEERRVMGQLLSALAIEYVVIDQAGHVVYRGEPERPTATPDDELPACTAKPSVPITQATIDKAVAEYRASAKTRARPYFVTSVGSDARDVKPLYVVPLGQTHSKEAEFMALLVSSRNEPVGVEALVEVFSLSPAEAKVVRRAMLGMKAKDIARELPLTEQTVRTYLKHSYEKLGVSGQRELIVKVGGLSVPLGASKSRASQLIQFRRKQG